MTNAKVFQGFHDDKKVEEHWLRIRLKAWYATKFHAEECSPSTLNVPCSIYGNHWINVLDTLIKLLTQIW